MRVYELVSHSPRETREIGRLLGQSAVAGNVIALCGDLGTGKTCLTQGIARGLDVPRHVRVTSPTYTLINEYHGRLSLFHVDLYRLGDESEFEELGLDEIIGGEGVVVIEWAEKLPVAAANPTLTISIQFLDDQIRRLHVTGYGQDGLVLIEKLSGSVQEKRISNIQYRTAE